ncbi:protein FAM210B, mitochondrial [Rhincodon typus]|uniref:protein FAM210B, mitochondrial n=1 Tax=Rhincodon typus TaxID=259920 RepID=UPI00202F0A14|nr:protein FAM210B, mitochondrial [Rhincodon typus]
MRQLHYNTAEFTNRKGFLSINILVVYDLHYHFLEVCVWYPAICLTPTFWNTLMYPEYLRIQEHYKDMTSEVGQCLCYSLNCFTIHIEDLDEGSEALSITFLFVPPQSESGDGTTRKEVRRFNSSDSKKLTKSQQLKQVFKEYGAVGVVFHVGISLTSLGIFYLVVSSGVDVAALLYKVGFSEAVVQSRMAAGTSTFVLAYAVHKVFAPVRMSITLVSVPFIVRYFRKIGLFKASTSKP